MPKKIISNKMYNEFWNEEELDIKKEQSDNSNNLSSEEIKKLEKKLGRKVSAVEKELRKLKEKEEKINELETNEVEKNEPKIDEVKEDTLGEEIKPVNPPRGWHARSEFIDEVGNKFEKGVYVGKISVESKVDYISKNEVVKEEESKEVIDPKDVKNKPINKEIKKVKKPINEIKNPTNNKPLLNKSLVNKEKINESLPKTVKKPINILTNKEIYQKYIDDEYNFRIYHRGNLLFDSKNHSKESYPSFENDGFILFGKNYIYRGIRIEKY